MMRPLLIASPGRVAAPAGGLSKWNVTLKVLSDVGEMRLVSTPETKFTYTSLRDGV